MDGHTSHINLAVAEFCREKSIILFCLPPHASHILQPLDVSVYGPLKQFWNNSLQEFSRKYKGLSMSRKHFFPVFDAAWKKAVESPANIISGFRKTGLLPFQPDAVPYDKLMGSTANTFQSKDTVNQNEKIGMLRMFSLIEDCLPTDLKNLFQECKTNGYNEPNVDESPLGILWKIYSKGCNLINHFETAKVNASHTIDTQVPDSNDTDSQKDQIPIENSANESLSKPEDSHLQDLTSVSLPQGTSTTVRPSTSGVKAYAETFNKTLNDWSDLQMSYVNWNHSPFKNFFTNKRNSSNHEESDYKDKKK